MTIEEPYGDLTDTSMDVVSWNVWGRFGPYEQRSDEIGRVLTESEPDIIVLQESWSYPDGESQAERLARQLGFEYFAVGQPGPRHDDWHIVSAAISRWPIVDQRHATFPSHGELRGWPGEALSLVVDGPRGRIPVVNVSLDWPPQSSELRQASVREVALLCKELGDEPYPVVVCGDFNAGPASTEMRMLTGDHTPAVPGFVLFDAWAKAGSGTGHTWDRSNRWVAPTTLPSRRIDYIMTGWPASPGGRGDVTGVQLIGDDNRDLPPSDHYGLQATLRY